jgi:predicted NUDIX family NTP pyrophosphohydrolase
MNNASLAGHAGRAGHANRVSSGILLFRRTSGRLEFLLAHPGGPLFVRRDEGVWTIPKGEVEGPAEAVEAPAGGPGAQVGLDPTPNGAAPASTDLIAVARREFAEETGHDVPPGELVPLGSIRQKGGKVVHAWAVEGDLDPADASSNEFEMEWPPRSGRRQCFPEIDRVAWFDLGEARRRLKDTQAPFLERLAARLDGGGAT